MPDSLANDSERTRQTDPAPGAEAATAMRRPDEEFTRSPRATEQMLVLLLLLPASVTGVRRCYCGGFIGPPKVSRSWAAFAAAPPMLQLLHTKQQVEDALQDRAATGGAGTRGVGEKVSPLVRQAHHPSRRWTGWNTVRQTSGV